LRVADYITDFIYKLGVDTVFTLVGGGSIYLDDSLELHPNMKYICVCNEATAPMMAEAYARIKGGMGATYVTTGPGGTNAVTGLAEAYVDSAPIIIISGQVPLKHTTHLLNKSGERLRTFGTQELDIISVVKPLTKYAEMITDPKSIRYHLEKAAYLAAKDRKGPVWLDIPLDIQAAEITPSALEGFTPEDEKEEILYADLCKVIDYLQRAERPLIIAGQGIRASKSIPIFRKLVQMLNIPIVFSRLGQDLLPHNHPNVIGHGGTKGIRAAATIMREADVILCLGSRLSIPFVGDNLEMISEDAEIIVVDIDFAELRKPGVLISLAIQADVSDFIKQLINLLSEIGIKDHSNWMSYCRDVKEREAVKLTQFTGNPINLYWFLYKLDLFSEDYHIFISDAGSSYFVSGQMLKFERGQREITSGAFASMGLTIPLAIGTAVACPNKQILAVTGDGSLELNMQELKTMACNRLNIKLFVINNGGYASIRNTQDALLDSRYVGSNQYEAGTLNLKALADTFGLDYYKIDDWKTIDKQLNVITKEDTPAFIEVICTPKQIILEKKNNWGEV